METAFLLWLQETIRSPWLTPIMQFITSLGDHGILAITTCLALVAYKETRHIGTLSALSLAINVILTNVILKNIFARIRPYEVIKELTLLTGVPHDFSFPSGHTSSSFAVAGILFLYCPPKIGIPALIIAALIGFSRLYVGIHYPSDVVIGMLVGILCSYLVYKIDGHQRIS